MNSPVRAVLAVSHRFWYVIFPILSQETFLFPFNFLFDPLVVQDTNLYSNWST